MGSMKLENEIMAFARETLSLQKSVEVVLAPLEGRGSDRAYFRFRWNSENSAIVVRYRPERIENTYFAEIASFLLENEIPVPQIIRHDAARCLIMMRDLGEKDLWSFRNEPWAKRKSLYRKTLMIAHRLHSFAEERFPSDHVKLMEAFGPDLYRWERNYFRDSFVVGFCGIELNPESAESLEIELAGLAQRLSTGERSLVHRDLQSQNVLIHDDEPFLIDFQGMRLGTYSYDLGSLLCDPYVAFSGSERQELLSFYYGLSEPGCDWNGFQNRFWEASAQRLMQALGAYGFLGLRRGLRDYLAYIPAGLQNLRAAAEKALSLPRLLETCALCDKALRDEKIKFHN
jgi:aminoglycoside/choline kinase family phosphotransferase